MLRPMKSPDEAVALPLDYAAELAVEMQLMRAECCEAAHGLLQEGIPDEIGLEECAVLDEALAKAQALLNSAVGTIRRGRTGRNSARM